MKIKRRLNDFMFKLKLIKAIKVKHKVVTIDNIDLSDVSFRIFKDIGGYMLTRGIGKSNQQGRIGGSNTQGDIGGDNGQGHVKGNNYQGNIGGYNAQYKIGEYNHQLDIGGFNRQGNIKGDNSQWNIQGNNEQLIVTGRSMNSQHWIDELQRINSTEIDCTDGVLLHSVTVRKLKRGVEYVTGMSSRNEEVYLVKTPNMSYHSTISMKDAKEGFKNKRDRLMSWIGEWVSSLTDESIITREMFHEKTGACKSGINAWCKKLGIERSTKSITFKEFRRLAEHEPTMETKRILFLYNELKGGK